MAVLLVLVLCGCQHSRPKEQAKPDVNPGSQVAPVFQEAAAQAIACVTGMRDSVLSSNIVYDSQRAKCVERISYLQQIQKTEKELQIFKAVSHLEGQSEVCRAKAKIHAKDFGACLDEFRHLYEQSKQINTSA